MKSPKLAAYSKKYIHKLKSGNQLSNKDKDRIVLLLLLLAYQQPFKLEKKPRKPEEVASDIDDVKTYEDFISQGLKSKEALKKTFGKRHKMNEEYWEQIITRGRKEISKQELSDEDLENRFFEELESMLMFELGQISTPS